MLNQKKTLVQRLLPHLVAILVFIAVTLIYFSPIIQGKVLRQGDVTQYEGAARELSQYHDKEGGSSAWTGSMFSGMPSYHIGIWGGHPNFLTYVEAPVRAVAGHVAGPVLMSMVMAYILFLAMGFKPSVSIAGAIAYSLSSYNIIILEAGHMNKAWAIAYMPTIIASMFMLLKRKYVLSGILMALGLALQMRSNHFQMTYYTGIMCAIVYVGIAIDFIGKKEYKNLLKGSGILIIAVTLACFANYGSFYSNNLMAEESIRGQSELSGADNSVKQSSGLDKDYAFEWSYGKSETFTLLVPNAHGGVSKPFGKDTEPLKIISKLVQTQQLSEGDANFLYGRTTEYFGSQRFTSGPVYLGAIVCFLFILGMFIIRNKKMKWCLFIATLFFIFLSWGSNFEVFNDFFFYHFPMYNKFRAVSSALVIPTLAIVILAIWGLKEFLSGEIDKKEITNSLYISVIITGGICLLLWIAPGMFFNFTSLRDSQIGADRIPEFYQSVLQARKDLLSADALRSLVFILLTAGLLLASLRVKMEQKTLAIGASLGVALLILIDMWGVDKRYLSDDNFINKSQRFGNTFHQSFADQFILQDAHPSYRVLSVRDPFNDAITSYHHKSIGGYNAVKMRRYQELIEYNLAKEVQFISDASKSQLQTIIGHLNNKDSQITPENIPTIMQESLSPAFGNTTVLNMLNTRYVIYEPQLPALENPYALGNAWFVSDYSFVNNADEELASLNSLDPLKTAIIDKRFEQEVSGLNIVTDSMARIELTTYKPNKVTYTSKANSEQLAVFSEVYFAEGWEVLVDGKPAPHFRADWILRAMRVPAGEHEIVFEFIPHKYNTSTLITSIGSALLLLIVIGAGIYLMRCNCKKED